MLTHENAQTSQEDPVTPPETLSLKSIRIGVMVGAFLQLLASYFCRDIPQALQSKLMLQLNINDEEYNLLYSFLAFSSILTSIPFGTLLDTFGNATFNTLTALLLIISQGLITLSAYYRLYLPMLVCRFIEGIALNQQIIETILVAKIFHGCNASFYMGITICFAKIGNITNSILTPLLYHAGNNSIVLPNAFGLVLSFLALGGTLVMNYCESHFMQGYAQNSEASTAKVNESLSFERTLELLKGFTRPLWLVLSIGTILYSIFYTFTNFGSNLLEDYFGFSYNSANMILAVFYLIAAVVTPLSGYIIDRFGARPAFFALSCSFGVLFTFIALLWMPLPHPAYIVVPLTCFMLFYCFLSSNVWVAIPLSAGSEAKGLAIGVMQTIQGVGLFTFPIIAGLLKGRQIYNGYAAVLIFFSISYTIALLLSLLLILELRDVDHELHWTSDEIQRLKLN